MEFVVTMEMSPSCRILAYYVTNNGEVVADSAVLEVEQQLPNKVSFTPKNMHKRHESPGSDYTLEMRTTPGSMVGILGVDESVYLLRKYSGLTPTKIFKDIKNLDRGCGVGPGKDSKEVFEKSGVVILTNINTSPSPRTRKKRSLSPQDQACCDNGKFFSRASCTLRARFMVKASVSCREAFLNCCRIEWNEPVPKEEIRQRQFTSRNGRSFDEAELLSEQTRHYFPETWLFLEEHAGSSGEIILPLALPDSITSWILQGVSISNLTGIGLAKPYKVTTFKDFFVSLTLPYSAQRGEQLSVIATVFNYGNSRSKFEVRLLGNHAICSQANPGVHSKPITFDLQGNDVKSVAFPIVPIQLYKVQIRVSVTRRMESDFDDLTSTDTVERELLVLPEGAERRRLYSLVLDPQGVLREESNSTSNSSNSPPLKMSQIIRSGHQVHNIMLDVPKRAIPGSLRGTISLTGNLIGPVVTNLIQGGLGDILRMPLGCGEQNMIYLAPNVYTLEYLTNTGQVTADIESRAYEYIQQGYQQQLGFRRKDKSFSAFGETRPGSTWLTAFVIKVLTATANYDGIAIDEAMLCESVEWLLSNQRSDGAFPENHDLVHKSLLGGINGVVAMTAYVVMSLQESRCSKQKTEAAINKAIQYLEQEVDLLNEAHVLALTTYSLALVNSPVAIKANSKLMLMSIYDSANATRHWSVGGDAINVETAGYALLAQLQLGRLKHSGPIVKWLTEHRNSKGGFVSTQDTCVALQALAKYSERTVGANLDLSVSIQPERDPDWKRTFHMNANNAIVQTMVDVTPFLGGELFIDSIGTGVSQMQIEIVYNVPSSKNETCVFDVRIVVKEVLDNKTDQEDLFIMAGNSRQRNKRDLRSKKRRRRRKKCRGRNKKRCKKNRKNRKNKKVVPKDKKKNPTKKPNYKKTQKKAPDSLLLNICTRYRKAGKSGMAIMDIGIFTGFEPNRKSLIELQKNVRPTVDRFEFSDRSVVLYIKEVPSTKEFCAVFRVDRIFGVGAVQPVPIKVYDYYEPGDACTKFYSPDENSELSLGICEGEQCECTQDDCSPCKFKVDDVDSLVTKACREHEFVIGGKVLYVDEETDNKVSWLSYYVQVQRIFKQKGNMTIDDIIEYKKRAGCACPDFLENQDYLIMGQEEGFQLVLNKNTLVLPWVGTSSSDTIALRTFRGRMSQTGACFDLRNS